MVILHLSVCDVCQVLFLRYGVRYNHRRTGIFGLNGRGGGLTLLARRNYLMLKYVSVEIPMQMHSNCMKNVYNFLMQWNCYNSKKS